MIITKEPTFDRHGYPTEEDTLDFIRNFDILAEHNASKACQELLIFCAEGWKYPDKVETDGRTYTFITCGWSGNESIIVAMKDNFLFWGMTWHLSERGGRHVFKVPGEK